MGPSTDDSNRTVRKCLSQRVERYYVAMSVYIFRAFYSLLWLLAWFPGANAATLASLSLEEMLTRSDVVVVASVTTIEASEEDPGRGLEGRRSIANLKVEHVLKGPRKGKLSLSYFPESPAGYRLTVGERFVFFLNRQGDHLFAVQGDKGLVRVMGNAVHEIRMIGENPDQKLEEFLMKIASKVRSKKR
jgi:hypothetical protein